MASYDEHTLSRSPTYRGAFPSGKFLLLQDDTPPPLTARGHGVLTQLIRNRSHGSLHHYGSTWHRGSFSVGGQDDEEAANPLLRHHDRPFPSPLPPGTASDGAHSIIDERRMSEIMQRPHMRSMRLIGNSNPRYRWGRYWKTEEELKVMKKPVREYYERINYLIQQYLYIDRLLDSSLPHDLLNEYNNMPPSAFRGVEVPPTISESEEPSGAPSKRGSSLGGSASTSPPQTPADSGVGSAAASNSNGGEIGGSLDADLKGSSTSLSKKVKRTPKDIYRPTETTPLFHNDDDDDDDGNPKHDIPWLEEDDDVDSGDRIVTLAIWVNFIANAILLAGKLVVVLSVPSMSVLASLVDAMLDFLSTVIVGITTWLISRQDQYKYPVGRRKLEPIGVLVFSVIMITSFVQVALEAVQRLASPEHEIIELGIPAITIMASTIFIKGLCWVWCRLVRNSSVQALAADAMTDVIFNTGSILFPIVGFYAKIWWLDALGGLLLSLVVIFNWSETSLEHIKHLCGFSATADQRNILLYLTMRFANTIRQIQGLQAYHAGDKLNVEVDIVLDASTPLRDSHDLSESLSYILESVPIVDRAFVHVDYASYNLPTHMQQQSR